MKGMTHGDVIKLAKELMGIAATGDDQERAERVLQLVGQYVPGVHDALELLLSHYTHELHFRGIEWEEGHWTDDEQMDVREALAGVGYDMDAIDEEHIGEIFDLRRDSAIETFCNFSPLSDFDDEVLRRVPLDELMQFNEGLLMTSDLDHRHAEARIKFDEWEERYGDLDGFNPNKGRFVIYDDTFGFYMTDDDGNVLQYDTNDDALDEIRDWFLQQDDTDEFTVYDTATGEPSGGLLREEIMGDDYDDE